MNNNKNPYADIIDLPHHVSSKRNKMPLKDRAAQFASFAAVVGHESAVKEAARLTSQRKDLDETEKVKINEELREIESQLPDGFEVEVVYFVDDQLKTGGAYKVKVARVKKIDIYTNEIHMIDGEKIAICDVYSIKNNPSKSY
ncbi:MAG: hypothetical protein GY928_36895 [Colwellia sp.]|nr:hypothetical protein [Colwellia sp.]